MGDIKCIDINLSSEEDVNLTEGDVLEYIISDFTNRLMDGVDNSCDLQSDEFAERLNTKVHPYLGRFVTTLLGSEGPSLSENLDMIKKLYNGIKDYGPNDTLEFDDGISLMIISLVESFLNREITFSKEEKWFFWEPILKMIKELHTHPHLKESLEMSLDPNIYDHSDIIEYQLEDDNNADFQKLNSRLLRSAWRKMKEKISYSLRKHGCSPELDTQIKHHLNIIEWISKKINDPVSIKKMVNIYLHFLSKELKMDWYHERSSLAVEAFSERTFLEKIFIESNIDFLFLNVRCIEDLSWGFIGHLGFDKEDVINRKDEIVSKAIRRTPNKANYKFNDYEFVISPFGDSVSDKFAWLAYFTIKFEWGDWVTFLISQSWDLCLLDTTPLFAISKNSVDNLETLALYLLDATLKSFSKESKRSEASLPENKWNIVKIWIQEPQEDAPYVSWYYDEYSVDEDQDNMIWNETEEISSEIRHLNKMARNKIRNMSIPEFKRLAEEIIGKPAKWRWKWDHIAYLNIYDDTVIMADQNWRVKIWLVNKNLRKMRILPRDFVTKEWRKEAKARLEEYRGEIGKEATL